ncbi:DUF6308 family protein [Kineosporia babensis]|uniref:DUF6308 family protein n=1 Tax=Kineosporia babensis TaxID=499548 RepID=A0A9X1NHN1_9ACTN|nr:DUF6308 family protein [Kineosporia babensis]
MTTVRVGRFSVSQTQAENWLLDDTAMNNARCGYPAYEEYRAQQWSGPLEDADLLAPVLLESPVPPESYSWLRERLPALNRALESIAPNADIASSATPLELIAPLFDGLGEPGGEAVGMPVLAGVLHRKRPRFVPLWDARIRACYYGPDAPVTPVGERSPGQFATAVAAAVRADLAVAPNLWKGLAGIADRPPITPLRALSIVARHLGDSTGVVPEQREPTPGLSDMYHNP